MKKIYTGLLLGAIAGIIDVIPMILQKLTWDANISAFVMWIIVGFFVSTSNLKIKGALRGVLFSFLVFAPAGILIGWQDIFNLIPISIMNLILGCLLGFSIEKFGK